MNRRKMRFAYTLLELLVSMLVLYIACSYLMSLFSSGWRFSLRNREYSMTTFLARNKMEYLSCMPADKLTGGSSGLFSEPYGGYSWRAELSDYNGELKLLTLEVVSPLRTRTKLYRLLRGRAFLGVACDEYSDQVIWSSPRSCEANFRQNSASNDIRQISLDLTGGNPCHIGAVCGVPGRGAMWASCVNRAAVGYYVFNGANDLTTRFVLEAPSLSGMQPPVFTGIAGDRWGNKLFCADSANGAVWIAEDGVSKNALRWSAESPLRPAAVPLQKPMGVALDEHASILWIAESTARAIRPLYLNTDIKPSGKGVEAIPGVGWWGARISLPEGTDSVQGLAVNVWSSSLYAVDDNHLYVLLYKMSPSDSLTYEWAVYSLPVSLRRALPSGLACDPYKNIVYINTSRGNFWQAFVQGAPAYKNIR